MKSGKLKLLSFLAALPLLGTAGHAFAADAARFFQVTAEIRVGNQTYSPKVLMRENRVATVNISPQGAKEGMKATFLVTTQKFQSDLSLEMKVFNVSDGREEIITDPRISFKSGSEGRASAKMDDDNGDSIAYEIAVSEVSRSDLPKECAKFVEAASKTTTSQTSGDSCCTVRCTNNPSRRLTCCGGCCWESIQCGGFCCPPPEA